MVFLASEGALGLDLFGSNKIYSLKNCTVCSKDKEGVKSGAGECKQDPTPGRTMTANTDYKNNVFVLKSVSPDGNIFIEDATKNSTCSFESASSMACERVTKEGSAFSGITKKETWQIANGKFRYVFRSFSGNVSWECDL